MNPSLSPIIILGMHRSGTTMISRVLEQCGLFLGEKKDSNFESWFFLDINDWMLRNAGGSWDNPSPFTEIFKSENKKVLEIFNNYCTLLLNSPKFSSYIGKKRFIKYRYNTIDFQWGWKDPRNTFTLPVWLSLFPDARVVHVYRNGIDIASSLKERKEKEEKLALERLRKRKWLYLLNKRKPISTAISIRAGTLDGAFSIYEEYMKKAKEHTDNLGSKCIEVKYETFLQQPEAELNRLLKFCSLECPDSKLHEVTSKLKPERAFAFEKDQNLLDFALSKKNILEKYGY